MPEYEQKKSGKPVKCRFFPPLLLCGILTCAILFCGWLILERYGDARAADDAGRIKYESLSLEKQKLEGLLGLPPCEAAAQYKTMQNIPGS